MTGDVSPTGEKHPGTIAHEDQVDGRKWTVRAAEVPRTIAWIKVHERWVAVTRIVAIGTRERREILQYAADGTLLQSTIQAPPPRR